jgi:hypothetical protein
MAYQRLAELLDCRRQSHNSQLGVEMAKGIPGGRSTSDLLTDCLSRSWRDSRGTAPVAGRVTTSGDP